MSEEKENPKDEWVYQVRFPEGSENPPPGIHHVLSIFHPDEMERLGKLPPLAIVGIFEVPKGTDPMKYDLNLADFHPNRDFRIFLHQIIEQDSLNDPEFQKVAKNNKEADIRLIDLRAPAPQNEAQPEDIFGILLIREGKVTGYEPNPEHRLYSKGGMFQLPKKTHVLLLQELRKKYQSKN